MDETSNLGGLKEFWSFVRDFKSVESWVAKSAVAAPLIDLVLNIGSPWPTRIGVTTLICVIEICILMYAFEFWRRSKPKLRKTMRASLIVFFLILPVHLSLFSVFVQDNPDMFHRDVIGFRLDPGIEEWSNAQTTPHSPGELLTFFERDPMNIWQPWSVHVARLAVLSTWLAFWFFFGSFVAAFVLLRRQTEVPAGAQGRGTRRSKKTKAAEDDEQRVPSEGHEMPKNVDRTEIKSEE